MAEERPEQRTWYRGAVNGYMTRAEYVRALALHEKTGEQVWMLHCPGREPEAEAAS